MLEHETKPGSTTQLSVPDILLGVATTQADIHIVGLGPGPVADLTLGVWQTLLTAAHVVVRTRRHPCIDFLQSQIEFESFDPLYEQHGDFAAVYTEIASQVVELGKQPGGVVYAVPGHPWVGEVTTRLILAEATSSGLHVHITGGSSFVEPSYGAVGVDIMDGGQVVDAMLLAQQHHPLVDVGLPLLVGQLYAGWLASDVKLTLMNAYPDEHPVTLIQAAGTTQQRLETMPLHTLDRQGNFDHLTSLYVPPVEQFGSFSDLQGIIAHLRAPEGCPWDRKQTLATLRQDLLGECVEVLEAIDKEENTPEGTLEDTAIDNGDHIVEELGDLLLVATMMVQIATEEGRFQMGDVTRGIVTKLIRRHPHVFDNVVVSGVGEVLTNWDEIKAAEKAAKGQTEDGPLDGVPVHLPALEKARKLQSKAHKANLLDRTELARAIPELGQMLGNAPDEGTMGELLWTLVALAHTHDINAEDALRSYAQRFRDTHH